MLRKFIAIVVMVALVLPALAVSAAGEGTILEVAAKDGRFTTLLAAVKAAGLEETWNGKGPFTVFAPTDDAFAKWPKFVVDYLVSDKELLTRVLSYHVVAENTPAADVMAAKTLKSVEGGEIVVTVNDKAAKVNSANVIAADVAASNGVIHVIDSIILPEIELPEADPLSVKGNIVTAGSSTVYPVTERMADLFGEAGFEGNGTITVDNVGTGAGFERFCKNAETDVANASRPIKSSEVDDCKAKNRDAVGFYIGIDALAIAVSAENKFLDNLTQDQLKKIFSGEVKKWSEVDASYPAEDIKLFSPGTDSGTFDYFVEHLYAKDKTKILGANPQLSEDDNVLVQGVAASPYAIGYFGYAYFIENTDKLKALNIDGVTPNAETAETNKYPLSRPLYIYTTAELMATKPQVAAFINFFLQTVEEQLGTEEGKIGYFPVSSDPRNTNNLIWLAAMDAQ